LIILLKVPFQAPSEVLVLLDVIIISAVAVITLPMALGNAPPFREEIFRGKLSPLFCSSSLHRCSNAISDFRRFWSREDNSKGAIAIR
jgi:hypothetical protein